MNGVSFKFKNEEMTNRAPLVESYFDVNLKMQINAEPQPHAGIWKEHIRR